MSGTSMAAPHVAGLIAYLIARDGNIAPAAMQTKLQGLAKKNALKDIREYRCFLCIWSNLRTE